MAVLCSGVFTAPPFVIIFASHARSGEGEVEGGRRVCLQQNMTIILDMRALKIVPRCLLSQLVSFMRENAVSKSVKKFRFC